LAIDQGWCKAVQCYYDLANICKKAETSSGHSTISNSFTLPDAIFTEQEFRLKSLGTAHELKQTTGDKEIFYLRMLPFKVRSKSESTSGRGTSRHHRFLNWSTKSPPTVYLADREVKTNESLFRPLSLVIFDIDHFKRVNDSFGHLAGDRVLTGISKFVQSSVRDCDVVGRIGGEEFAMLLPETSEHSALIMFERIRKAIAELNFEAEENLVSVTMAPESPRSPPKIRKMTLRRSWTALIVRCMQLKRQAEIKQRSTTPLMSDKLQFVVQLYRYSTRAFTAQRQLLRSRTTN
jgi:diguanylate cyclase (GGDEF)-like protein